MKPKGLGENYFFVDESGDSTFYDRKGCLIVSSEGCSPILLLGFIETRNPKEIRRSLLDLQAYILHDKYLQQIPSIEKTKKAFHAKDDAPEVRYLVYKLMAELDFKAQFIVARKTEKIFRNSFNARPWEFYDHLVSHLFERVLHRYEKNHVVFAKRGSRERQEPLKAAIERGITQLKQKTSKPVNASFNLQTHRPTGEPCLSVIDYMNWAVYRAFTRREMRYYQYIESKVSLLVDLYDREKYPQNWYHRRNPFDIEKTTPL